MVHSHPKLNALTNTAIAENLHFGGGGDERSIIKLEIITSDPGLRDKELQQMVSSVRQIELAGVRWFDAEIHDHVFGLKKLLLAWYVNFKMSDIQHYFLLLKFSIHMSTLNICRVFAQRR